MDKLNITQVFKLNLQEKESLEKELRLGDFAWKKVAHAEFQVQSAGLNVILYKSGKLVVQGKNSQLWITQYLARGVNPEPSKQTNHKSENWPNPMSSIGSDEAGKGDSFGGIVVCAVGLSPDSYDEVVKTNICDSKKMSDALILQLAPWLKERVAYKKIALSPTEYNEAWRRCGENVNNLLTDLHTKCINTVLEQGSYESIVIDRFSPRHPVTKKLRQIKKVRS